MASGLSLAAIFAAAGLAAPSLAVEAPTKVVATASTHPEGVVVGFELPEPVTQLRFGTPAEAVRNETWSVLTADVVLKGDQVVGSAPFRRFKVLIRPDKTEVDRGYPALVRVGDGHTLYGPYFLVRGVETELTLARTAAEARLPAHDAWKGYAYLGPKIDVERLAGVSLVAGPKAPTWLSSRIRADAPSAVNFYKRALATPLSGVPTVIVTDQGAGPMPLRGDVTDGLTVSLRFHGEDWRQEKPAWAREARKTMLHEAFHLWNSHTFQSAEGDAAPWLHEGGAEYAALVAGASTGALTEEQAREQLASSLSGCRNSLKDRPLGSAKITKGSAVYTCGVLVQWLADLQARRSGGDTFSVWRQVFARASRNHMTYSLSDFRAASGGADGALSLALDEGGSERWPRLAAALQGYGVTLKEEPTAEAYRVATVFHLNSLHCTEKNTGFFTQDGYLKLDTRAVCGPLSGDPEIVAMEGENLLERPAEAYAAVERRCRSGGVVSLQRRGGGPDLRISCAKPMVSPRSSYVIVKSPKIAIEAVP